MSKTKKKHVNYNDVVIDELRCRYGFTRDYILKSIRGDRVGSTAIRIQEEYWRLDRMARQAIRRDIERP